MAAPTAASMQEWMDKINRISAAGELPAAEVNSELALEGIQARIDEMKTWRHLVYPRRVLWWSLNWVKTVRKYKIETRESIAKLSINRVSSPAAILQGVYDFYSTKTNKFVRQRGSAFQNMCGEMPILCKDLGTDTAHASHFIEAADALVSRTQGLFLQKTQR